VAKAFMTLREILSVAICVIVSLVMVAIATRYLRPHWIFSALHSLQLHFAAACFVALIVALILHRNPVTVGLLVAALALTAHAIIMMVQIAAPAPAADAQAPGFKLLSFNILSSNYRNGEAMADMIAASGADIVNVMEAEPLLAHLNKLDAIYPYRIGCGATADDYCDQLLLSKTPLAEQSVRDLSPIFDHRFILVETELAGRTVTVGGIHTTKPYFDNFQTMELLRAALAITDTQGPLVVAGDFNASSLAPNMQDFLHRTELRTAGFEPPTWPTRLGIFGLPIDHVYVRAPLRIRSLTTLPQTYGSNHAGLLADIAIGDH
jgi:endonuclease/exonuclease/phosphatase (EEP) superfamily protein YafD